jgi:hypothetical protein
MPTTYYSLFFIHPRSSSILLLFAAFLQRRLEFDTREGRVESFGGQSDIGAISYSTDCSTFITIDHPGLVE